MSQYFISSKPLSTGSHVLHRIGCPLLRIKDPGVFLGEFNNTERAVSEGLKHFRNVGTCPFCLKEHHAESVQVVKVTQADNPCLDVRFKYLKPVWDSFLLYGVN